MIQTFLCDSYKSYFFNRQIQHGELIMFLFTESLQDVRFIALYSFHIMQHFNHILLSFPLALSSVKFCKPIFLHMRPRNYDCRFFDSKFLFPFVLTWPNFVVVPMLCPVPSHQPSVEPYRCFLQFRVREFFSIHY